MLHVDHLRKTYGEGAGAVEAIHDVSFDVDEKEFVCVVGPSGCGKTTLLKCMSGLLSPSGGEVRLGSERVEGPPEKMALVFQEYNRSLFPWMTVRQNVAFPLRRRSLDKRESVAIVEDAVESVDLSRFLDRYPWELSGGMQQRVAIARALAYQPEILLMDEPFASVDAQTRADLEDLVLQIRDRFGVTVVFVTHDIDESVYLSDRIVVLTPSPTEVHEVLDIPLPRPRNQIGTKELPEFAHLRAHVYRAIKRRQHQDVGEAAERPAAEPFARS
jgi:NitT/TauT family transport system ATP-binding protein